MLTFALDTDRLSALYRYSAVTTKPDRTLDALVSELSRALGGTATQIVFVDDHRVWTIAAAGPTLDEGPKQGSLSATAIEQSTCLVVHDLREDERFRSNLAVLNAPYLGAYAGVPLRTPDNHAIGVLQALDVNPRLFQPVHVNLLKEAASQIITLLEIRRSSRLDPSTGAMLAPSFEQQLQALAELSARHKQDLSLLVIEVDPFRTVLRNLKQDLGTLVIDRMGGLGRNNVRRLDSFGRLDEGVFAVLLPNTNAAGTDALAVRIVETLKEGWCLPAEDGSGAPRVGAGVATLRPGERASDLLRRALANLEKSRPVVTPAVKRRSKVA